MCTSMRHSLPKLLILSKASNLGLVNVITWRWLEQRRLPDHCCADRTIHVIIKCCPFRTTSKSITTTDHPPGPWLSIMMSSYPRRLTAYVASHNWRGRLRFPVLAGCPFDYQALSLMASSRCSRDMPISKSSVEFQFMSKQRNIMLQDK
jgi:hypothetical protein